jgi:hypothetical protein
VDGQHTDEPLPAHRPDNLYQPVAGDHGAHGRFDDQAHDASWQWMLNRHRTGLLAAGAACLGVALALRRGRRPIS